MDAETLAKQINDHARAMNADGLLLGKNLLAVAQHIDDLIPEGSILVDRARFERLRRAAEIMDKELTEKHGWKTWALFHPGDLDPLP